MAVSCGTAQHATYAPIAILRRLKLDRHAAGNATRAAPADPALNRGNLLAGSGIVLMMRKLLPAVAMVAITALSVSGVAFGDGAARQVAAASGDAAVARTAADPDAGAGAAVARAAADPGPGAPVVDCASHAEPSLERFVRGRDTIRGPFALVTSASTLRRLRGESYRPRRGRDAGVKLPVALRAGHRATLRVSPTQRRHAALTFTDGTRGARRVADADQTVVFEPCAAGAPAFSGGAVGPITGWAGAMLVSGPRCIRLQLWVDGERARDIRLPLGRRCGPA
jgi:hypothetical protein